MRAMTASIRRELGAKRVKCRFRIREFLDNSGITLPVLAEELGVSVPAISKVLNGSGHSQPILAKLRAVGVPEKYLFDPHLLISDSKGTCRDKTGV